MSILITAFIIVLLLVLVLYVIDLLGAKTPFDKILKALAVVIAILYIARLLL